MKALGLFVLILTMLPDTFAAIIISPGVGLTNAHQSVERNIVGSELVSFKSAFGITLESEWTFLNESIGLNIGALWRGSEAITQYSYTNPRNPLDTANVPDLDTNSSSVTGYLGPRFRFINMKYFKVFGGAGWSPGILYLSYNESKFLAANGSLVGFIEKEDKNFKGTYFEIGLELHSAKGNSLRLLGKQSQHKTERFESLGNKKINLTATTLAIQYMHIF